ncbi:hypothetical protein VTI28DRAFT_8320 [Corynascus sepedonium]
MISGWDEDICLVFYIFRIRRDLTFHGTTAPAPPQGSFCARSIVGGKRPWLRGECEGLGIGMKSFLKQSRPAPWQQQTTNK